MNSGPRPPFSSSPLPTSLRSPQSSRRLRAASTTTGSAPAPAESHSSSATTAHRSSSPSDELVAPLRVTATSVNIAELKRKSVPDLLDMANHYAIENPGVLRKQDLIFQIEQKLLDEKIALTGE